MPDQKLASKSQFADLRGVNPSQVTRWIERGLIGASAIVGEGRSAKIDVELAQRHLASRRDPGQALGNGSRPNATRSKAPRAMEAVPATPDQDDEDPDALDYGVQKARLAKAQADAQEMRNLEAMNKLLQLDEVVQRWSEVTAGVRAALLAVPKRLRDSLPHLSAADLGEVDAEIRRALQDLADGKFATG